ncbi:MAG: hypothetical protein C4345_10305 [Chloroflexota bacterium]
MPDEHTGEWLSVDEAAKYLGVTRRAIDRYSQTGKLRAYKMPIGDRTMFRREDSEAFKTPRPVGVVGKATAA